VRYFGAVLILVTLIAGAYAQTADDYLDRLKDARESVAAAVQDSSRAREAARKLMELENLRISTADGESVAVSNRWAAILAREIQADTSSIAARRAISKIEAIERQVKELESGATKPIDVELASGEEFGDGAPKPELGEVNLGIRERLRRLAQWLKGQEEETRELDERSLGTGPSEKTGIADSPGLFTVVVLILVAIIIAVIAFQIAKTRSGGSPGTPKISGLRQSSTLEDALKRTPRQWKELAGEFQDKGDYAQALRALYLSLLVVLHRRRLISYDTTKTNWEYVWELGIRREEHKPFEALTSAFDYKWYGRKECLSEEYRKLEEMADTIVERETKQE
jgi:hypothetical protein